MGNAYATEEDMIQALKNAQAYEIVMNKSAGMDTMVSEGGKIYPEDRNSVLRLQELWYENRRYLFWTTVHRRLIMLRMPNFVKPLPKIRRI